MLKNPETNPYPHKFKVTYDDSQFFEEFGHLKSGETAEDKEIRIAGRIYNKRASGSKLIFYGTMPLLPPLQPPLTHTSTDVRTSADTVSIGTQLQVVCQAQLTKAGAAAFEAQHEHIRRGDVIGIVGYAGRTNPKNRLAEGKEGELSVFATEIVLLSPCLHMLPSVRFPFADSEQRARMRYLDMLWNDRSRQVLWQRSRMVRFIRDCG